METDNKKVIFRVLKIIVNTMFYFTILLLLLFSIATIRGRKLNQLDLPNIFGIGFSSVLSDSMDGDYDDSFQKGDLIIVRMLNDKNRLELEVGDIVTFMDDNFDALNTHRIVRIFNLPSVNEETGETIYETFIVTKGDKPVVDSQGNVIDSEDSARGISEFIAVHRSTLSGWGATLNKLRTPTGFALAVVVPVAILLIIQGVILSKNLIELNKTKLEEKHAQEKEVALADLEAEKEVMRARILEELKKEQETKK